MLLLLFLLLVVVVVLVFFFGGGGVEGSGVDEGIGFDGVGVGDEDVAELVLEAGHGDLEGGVDLWVVRDGGGGHGPLDFVDGLEVPIHLVPVPVEDHLLAGFLRRRRVPPEDDLLRRLERYALRRLHDWG